MRSLFRRNQSSACMLLVLACTYSCVSNWGTFGSWASACLASRSKKQRVWFLGQLVSLPAVSSFFLHIVLHVLLQTRAQASRVPSFRRRRRAAMSQSSSSSRRLRAPPPPLPLILCPRCAGTRTRWFVSGTDRNPGVRFYKCPNQGVSL